MINFFSQSFNFYFPEATKVSAFIIVWSFLLSNVDKQYKGKEMQMRKDF